jgi:amidohydrolase
MKIIPFIICIMFCYPIYGQPVAAMDEIIHQDLNELTSIYKRIHAAPELSGYEQATSDLIASHLKSLGYEVTDHLGKYKNRPWKGYGVVAIFSNGVGPVLMIRTDMDALPLVEKTELPYASTVKIKGDSGQVTGVMHACGHDIHISVFLGVADVMMRLRSSWHGTLMMVAQPSEEGGPGASGAQALLEDGLYTKFFKPDFILGLHQTPSIVAGKLSVLSGYTNATSRDGDIVVHGKGAHASRPQDSKDPIVISAQLIMALQTIISRENNPFHPAVLTIGAIHGGTRSNIIPDQVTLKMTLRALDDKTCDQLAASVSRIIRGVAYTAGLPENLYPEVNISKGYPSNYNDPRLVDKLLTVFTSEFGKENLVSIDPVLSGEDFSYYNLQRTIPSVFFNIGGADPAKFAESLKTGIPLPSNHSPFMAPTPELTIQTGIKAMAGGAIALLKKAG